MALIAMHDATTPLSRLSSYRRDFEACDLRHRLGIADCYGLVITQPIMPFRRFILPSIMLFQPE